MKYLRINLMICMGNQAPDQKIKLCGFLDPTIGNYKSFTWQTSWGRATFPTPDLVHSQYIAVSKENYSQGIMLP